MQRISSPVFQTLQQQGAIEEESTSEGEGRTDQRLHPRRGGRGSWSRSEAFETPLSYSSKSGAYPSPPSSPLIYNTAGHSRHSGQEIPRGRRGGTRADSVAAPVPVQVEARLRPAPGSRALGTLSRSSAAEAVPSQLLGGRAEADAGVLTSDFRDFAHEGDDKRADPRKSVAAERLQALLSPNWPSRSDTVAAPYDPASKARTPSRTPTPAPSTSESSRSTPSISSQQSYASSFAALIRDRRQDLRLFKKRSKPSQHLKKNRNVSPEQSEPRRSPSYYQPKVVEDTAASLPGSSQSVSSTSSIALSALAPISNPASDSLLRKARSSPSQVDAVSQLSVPHSSPSQGPPNFPSFSLPRDIAQLGAHLEQERSETTSSTRSRSRDSPRNMRKSKPKIQLEHIRFAADPKPKPAYPFDSRPEAEPGTPFDTQDSHGDHYFRTFGTDTIYQKQGPVQPRLPPPEPPLWTLPVKPPTSRRPTVQRMVSDSSLPTTKSRRRSVLNLFGPPSAKHNVLDKLSGKTGDTSPASGPGTPDIVVTTPYVSQGKHDSYFQRARNQKGSSEATQSSAKSGLSTHWEEIISGNPSTGHVRERSEPLSPMSTPQTARPPLRRTYHYIAGPAKTRPLPTESIRPVVPSGQAAGPQPKYRSASGAEYYKASLTGPDALNWLPSEMTRVNTPPLQKPRGFKGFFFDMRSMPDEPPTADVESPEAPAIKRRRPILPKNSLQSLLTRLSRPNLKPKASQLIEVEQEEPVEDPLKVTGFQQTPFSQRYGDAKRAKKRNVRSYMDDTLKLSDESDSDVLQFELNVPEHLPSSPLCPLSPKHKSGGKAICPIHGRKKRSLGSNPSEKGKAVKRGPTIVFESGKGGSQGDGRDESRFEEFKRKTTTREGSGDYS